MVVLGGVLEEKSNIGLGCMSVSGQYDNGVPVPEADATALFKGMYDGGCRHFDTAEVYQSWDAELRDEGKPTPEHLITYNEAQLGKFFATVPRDTFTVGTKFQPLAHDGKCDYETVKAALVASLGRLGLESVDLYYSHRVLSEEQGVEFVTSCAKLKSEGLLKNIGLSEVSAAWLAAAHAVQPVAAIQQEWSLLTRGLEDELVPLCRELGIGIVAYSPLARNLLAAPKERPTDQRRASIPRFAEENFAKNKAMTDRLEALAGSKRVSAAQLSMAWLIQKSKDLGVDCLPIPGTKTLSHGLDNIASVAITLAPADMQLLEDIAEMTAGARESEAYMKISLEGNTEKARQEKAAAATARL
jgi:aryl-alcohol dehydrogenase-like predicted oxidoreductase